VIKSRRRWAGHVAHTDGKKNAFKIYLQNQKIRDHSRVLGTADNIKCILDKQGVTTNTGFIWLRIGLGGEYHD
jgi:hypothetical protein